LNAEYTTAQSDRVRKESAYASVSSGSLESAQVSTQGESLKKLSEQMDLQQQKFADVKAHFGANHPEYRKAALQIAELERQLSTLRRTSDSESKSSFANRSTAKLCCVRLSPKQR